MKKEDAISLRKNLPELPTDPLTGEPYKYVIKTPWYQSYQVGALLEDEETGEMWTTTSSVFIKWNVVTQYTGKVSINNSFIEAIDITDGTNI